MTSQKNSEIRLVIVEDHHATRKGLEFELNTEPDLKVIGSAATHLDGFRLAETLQPNVVLLDLHLPDSSGPKSLVAQYCAIPNVAVLVFSGENRPAILQIVLDSGVQGYLTKSEPVPQVAAAIREIMAGNTPVISQELLQSPPGKFTPAEKHLLRLLARGMKYSEIAAQRVTSPETVRKQLDQLAVKLEIRSREELIAWAVDNGYGKLEI
ncbi:MAG: response regulator transcription factor [Candidatus Obscuribacterales bacterium]|nr:response regulator transcription factor [Candidatus Obscuribacterales bacterium]